MSTNNVNPSKSAFDPANPLRWLEEGELIDLVLTRDEVAWRELVRRYDGYVRKTVSKRLAGAMDQYMASDAVDDVLGDFYVAIIDDDMRRLRRWANGPRKARLSSWLLMIACGIAFDHMRAAQRQLRRNARAGRRQARIDAEREGRCGSDWIIAEAAERTRVDPDAPEPKRKRKRVSRFDIV